MQWEKDSVVSLLLYINHGKENVSQNLKNEILKVQGTKKR